MFELFFLLSLILGQIVKIPFWGLGGATLLDISIILSSLFLLFKLRLRLKSPPLFVSMAMFFIFCALLSLLLSPLKLAPTETFISFSYTVRFFFYILFGWLLYTSKFKFLKISSEFFIKAGLILAVLGLIQLMLLPDLRFLQDQGWDPHYFRTVSTYLDPNFLGAFLILPLLLLAKRNITFTAAACFIVIFIALLTTFSRSSYLAFGVAFFSLSFLTNSKKLFGLTIILMFFLLTGFSIYQQMVSVPRNINREKSAENRIGSWEQGWEIFQKNPVLGAGFNSYRFALREYRLVPEQFIKSHGTSSNDSSLLFVASTTGIIGLISYLLFLLTMFIKGRKNHIFLSGLLALLVQSFFANILFYPPILIWIILNSFGEKSE